LLAESQRHSFSEPSGQPTRAGVDEHSTGGQQVPREHGQVPPPWQSPPEQSSSTPLSHSSCAPGWTPAFRSSQSVRGLHRRSAQLVG
jgi:hypothetical protein